MGAQASEWGLLLLLLARGPRGDGVAGEVAILADSWVARSV